jgi:hypothetical protein
MKDLNDALSKRCRENKNISRKHEDESFEKMNVLGPIGRKIYDIK